MILKVNIKVFPFKKSMYLVASLQEYQSSNPPKPHQVAFFHFDAILKRGITKIFNINKKLSNHRIFDLQ